MPEWLLKEENYEVIKDKDAFIDGSILAILKLLCKIRKNIGYKRKLINVKATLKLSTVILFIILIAITNKFYTVLSFNVFLLFLVSLLDFEQIKKIAGTVLASFIFTLLILIPSMILGNSRNSLLIVLKVLFSVGSINLLSVVTSYDEIIVSLKIFHIPDIFIFTIDITLKYIMLLGEIALNTLYSLKVRSIGKNKNKASTLSGIIGNMFINSKVMAEDMNNAMICRGFVGEYEVVKGEKLSKVDWIYLIFNVILIVLYFYIGRL